MWFGLLVLHLYYKIYLSVTKDSRQYNIIITVTDLGHDHNLVKFDVRQTPVYRQTISINMTVYFLQSDRMHRLIEA
jgi:hypothetical protein